MVVSAMKRYRLLLGLALLAVFVILPGLAQTSSGDYQTAKVLSVREVRHASLRNSRYPTTPQYTMDVAVQYAGQTYCTGYETPVLDEVHDLEAVNGKDVQVSVHGKQMQLLLPNGRHVRADLVKSTQC
jgi:hypothetical protein